METNLGLALIAARCAGVDLNTEIDALIFKANAKHDKRGAPLFEPITQVLRQLIAHQDLRDCLCNQVAWLPDWNHELKTSAARIQDAIAKHNQQSLINEGTPLTQRTQEEQNIYLYDMEVVLGTNNSIPIEDFKSKPDTPKFPYGLSFALNEDQEKAITAVKKWLASDSQFFALRGYAGTGKSTIMKIVSTLGANFHFSAPTNKATKVLGDCLGYPCRTTYSLLGMRMEQKDDQLVLTAAHDAPYLGRDPILCIDEAGTVPTVLLDLIVARGYRCLFVGDPAQLNPVGEKIGPVWKKAKERVTLRKVERFDNQLLALSMEIRESLRTRVWEYPIEDNNDGKEGVFVVSPNKFKTLIRELTLEDWVTTKICCWRNKTVAVYNNMVRKHLGFEDKYCVGEQILLASPVIKNGNIIAYTDEEFTIKRIRERRAVLNHPGVHDQKKLDCYLFDIDRDFDLLVPHNPEELASILGNLADRAHRAQGTARRDAWKVFWEVKEMFASVRYGYAMTAHRLQGTTLTNMFVDTQDILANPTKPEAFRALYVAATRPTTKLIVL